MLKKLGIYLKRRLKGTDLSEIADILIFGSAVKGKEFPKDIDLCLVFRKKSLDETILNIEKHLKGLPVHISSLTIDNFFTKPRSLIKTLLIEGISLFGNKPFIRNFGFSSHLLYSYNLSKLRASEKVRFVYLLKGRQGTGGLVEKMKGEWLADGCFLLPVRNDSEMLLVFKRWQIPFKRKEVLLH